MQSATETNPSIDTSSLNLIVNTTRTSDSELYRILPLPSCLLPTEQRDDNIDVHPHIIPQLDPTSYLMRNRRVSRLGPGDFFAFVGRTL